MTTNQTNVIAVLTKHPHWGRNRIAKELGLPIGTVVNVLKSLRDTPRPQAEEGVEQDFKKDSGVISSRTKFIKTLEDLLAYTKTDQKVWEVERYVVNKWEVGAKDNSGKVRVTPLFQVKAWLRRRVATGADVAAKLLEEFKQAAPVVGRPIRSVRNAFNGHLLEVSIFDLHLGKLCWREEVGEDYDLKITQSLFRETLETLLERAKGFPLEKILFPVGNDFFNVDNSSGTTTAGTPQSEDGRWQKSFLLGRRLMVEAIERLNKLAPVDVVMVAGNHDTERLFYLGDVLKAWFSKTAGVTVNNSPALRKYYRFGKCLIGFTHGKDEKHSSLPLIMATERPQDWAETKYREFHLGHWHHKKDIFFTAVDEHRGVRVRFLPSLTPSDAWHTAKGYQGLRAAEEYIWHREEGNIGHFSCQP